MRGGGVARASSNTLRMHSSASQCLMAKIVHQLFISVHSIPTFPNQGHVTASLLFSPPCPPCPARSPPAASTQYMCHNAPVPASVPPHKRPSDSARAKGGCSPWECVYLRVTFTPRSSFVSLEKRSLFNSLPSVLGLISPLFSYHQRESGHRRSASCRILLQSNVTTVDVHIVPPHPTLRGPIRT
ncbi:hypothetical protein BJV74DRAFT_255929 [Russula compacta]|nr:hypothetical protein BJV74DRAFT_255929 [Russula compacta]